MAICNDNGLLVGRMMRIFLADGCAYAEPSAAEWKYLGSLTTNGVDFSPSTTTSEADTGTGFVATLVTTSDMTISGELEIKRNDKSDEYGFHRLTEMYVTELKARRQPSLWVRQVTGSTITTAYCNITALSWDGGTNDIVTASIEFKPYDGDTVTVESLEPLEFTTDLPSTKSVATSSALTLGPVVVTGGVSPYTYVWRKNGVVISGETTDTYTKASAEAGDAGSYTVTVTDSSTVADVAISTACVVTVTA